MPSIRQMTPMTSSEVMLRPPPPIGRGMPPPRRNMPPPPRRGDPPRSRFPGRLRRTASGGILRARAAYSLSARPDRAVRRPGRARKRPASAACPLRLESQQRMHLARGGDHPLVLVGLVVLLDVLELVAVVAHQAVRLAQALRRDVALPVDALEARAVAEMEARHRIDGVAVHGLGVEEIVRREPQQQRAQRLGRGGVDPRRVLQHGEPRRARQATSRLGAVARAQALEPVGELRDRRERHEGPAGWRAPSAGPRPPA